MRTLTVALAGFVVGVASLSSVQADDLNRARSTVDAIRQADPPQASTTTKRDPTGDKVSDYKPPVKVAPSSPPPSPVNKMNPQNDPDVQRGIDSYRRPK